ncbi:hypothetical protein JHW43_007954 [Diplocarpon mali]|nr:hypothetical protein JHW43_007954 [Diplocarpon mali]
MLNPSQIQRQDDLGVMFAARAPASTAVQCKAAEPTFAWSSYRRMLSVGREPEDVNRDPQSTRARGFVGLGRAAAPQIRLAGPASLARLASSKRRPVDHAQVLFTPDASKASLLLSYRTPSRACPIPYPTAPHDTNQSDN